MFVKSPFFLFCILFVLVRSDYETIMKMTGKNAAILNDALFENHVVNQGRDYDMLLLFSYTSKNSQCQTCRKTMEVFAHVSTVWHEMTVDKPKLVFAVIPMDSISRLATVFQIETCPTLVYLSEKHPISNFSTSERLVFVHQQNDTLLADPTIRRFLHSITSIEVIEPTSNFLSIVVVCMLCLLIVLFAYVYLFDNPFFYQVMGEALHWEKICGFLMKAIVCGVMYDLLKKAPLLAVGPQGIGLFQRRGATIVEGALYGALVITIGSRFLSLLRMEEEMQQQSVEEKETAEEFISFNVSMIIICVLVLTVLFNLKTPWYLRKLSYSLFSLFS